MPADAGVASCDDGTQTALRVSVNAPLTFDSSVKQLVQIAFGHTLYIVPEEVRPDGEAMLSFVADHQLNVLDCTPAQLRLILNRYSQQSLPIASKLIVIGGEAIDGDTWSALSEITSTSFYNGEGLCDTKSHRGSGQKPQGSVQEPVPNHVVRRWHRWGMKQRGKAEGRSEPSADPRPGKAWTGERNEPLQASRILVTGTDG